MHGVLKCVFCGRRSAKCYHSDARPAANVCSGFHLFVLSLFCAEKSISAEKMSPNKC